MSKKYRKQKKSFPWLLIVFGGVLLIAAVLLFAGQNGGGGDDGGTPAITVDPQKFDYGYVKFGNDETFQIKVTNNGDGILRFKEQPYIEIVEGC
jgi:hypothetical protein